MAAISDTKSCKTRGRLQRYMDRIPGYVVAVRNTWRSGFKISSDLDWRGRRRGVNPPRTPCPAMHATHGHCLFQH